MPESDWTQENMAYIFIWFPWVGVVIGILMQGLFYLEMICMEKEVPVPELTFIIGMVILPVLVTGGIHMDGYLDTRDALSSWQPREKRLEILKDPHTGAFAVLSCAVYFLGMTGIYACVSRESIQMVSAGFVLSRVLSALSVLDFPQARETGMAAGFSENADKKRVRKILYSYLAVLCIVIAVAGQLTGAALLLAAGAVFLSYRHMALEQFGGVTGDLAGYFLQACEFWMALAAVLADVAVKAAG